MSLIFVSFHFGYLLAMFPILLAMRRFFGVIYYNLYFFILTAITYNLPKIFAEASKKY